MKNLAKLRMDAGLNQEQLSNKLGITQQTISKYERGIREPDHSTLIKLSDIFNCSVDYILGKTDKNIIEVDNIEKATRLSDEIIQILVDSGQLTKEEAINGIKDKSKESKILKKIEKAIKFAEEINQI